jgi:hypothetical protein
LRHVPLSLYYTHLSCLVPPGRPLDPLSSVVASPEDVSSRPLVPRRAQSPRPPSHTACPRGALSVDTRATRCNPTHAKASQHTSTAALGLSNRRFSLVRPRTPVIIFICRRSSLFSLAALSPARPQPTPSPRLSFPPSVLVFLPSSAPWCSVGSKGFLLRTLLPKPGLYFGCVITPPGYCEPSTPRKL